MAEVTYRVSDLDGKSKVTGEPVTLSLNESAVKLDLTDKQKEELVALLAPYFEKGQEVEVRTSRATSTRNAANPLLTGKAANASTDDVREWGRNNGHEVSDKGRLSNELYKAFNEAVNAAPENADVDA